MSDKMNENGSGWASPGADPSESSRPLTDVEIENLPKAARAFLDEDSHGAEEDDEQTPESAWPKADHVVLTNGGDFRCTHCGQSQDMQLASGGGWQLDVYAAAGKAFVRTHATCKAPSSPRCTFCHSPDHAWEEHVNATCQVPAFWLECGDTGTSSRAIFFHFTRGHAPRPDVPLDPSDFGRCFRLLSAPWAKGWRERIAEMGIYPGWAPLVAQWPDLEKLYLEEKATGAAPKLWAMLRELRQDERTTES